MELLVTTPVSGGSETQQSQLERKDGRGNGTITSLCKCDRNAEDKGKRPVEDHDHQRCEAWHHMIIIIIIIQYSYIIIINHPMFIYPPLEGTSLDL